MFVDKGLNWSLQGTNIKIIPQMRGYLVQQDRHNYFFLKLDDAKSFALTLNQ